METMNNTRKSLKQVPSTNKFHPIIAPIKPMMIAVPEQINGKVFLYTEVRAFWALVIFPWNRYRWCLSFSNKLILSLRDNKISIKVLLSLLHGHCVVISMNIIVLSCVTTGNSKKQGPSLWIRKETQGLWSCEGKIFY